MRNDVAAGQGALIQEVSRYLAVVDAFRAANCEPTWRPEIHPEVAASTAALTPLRLPSDIRLH